MTHWKTAVDDLALFGSPPSFAEALHVNRPNVGDRKKYLAHVDGIFDRGQFTNNGPLVRRLEQRVAQYLGVTDCVVTCNGTTALSLLLQAIGVRGEVIIPSFTFVSTAHTLQLSGMVPIFCDIDPGTWNLDPDHCESLVSDATSAIIGTHLWGRTCDTQRLEVIAARHGLRLLFDAAHAFGNSHDGRMVGGFGDAEVFSFHATKIFHAFEGGAVTTNDTKLAARLRDMRNFGFSGYDCVNGPGTNAKMPEVCAAMGLVNLDSFDSLLRTAQANYELYQRELDGIPGLKIVPYDQLQQNCQYIVLEVDEESAGLSRDQLQRILHAENVIARRYFYPGCHQMKPYCLQYPEADRSLPNTNDLAQRVLQLPGGSAATAAQIAEVCALVRLALRQAPELRPILETTTHADAGSTSGTNTTARTRRVAPHAILPIDLRGTLPSVEIRIPISANQRYLRMLQYFLESLQEFGGPIGRNAHVVVSVGADEPRRDLGREHSWVAEHSVEFRWLDDSLFRRHSYRGVGLHRMQVPSNADVVVLADADLLVAGDFDRALLEAHRNQQFFGCIAHVSPFIAPELQHIPSRCWWSWIFEEAGLPKPSLDRIHAGWGFMSRDARHRCCPDYFNYGFVAAPREHIERIGSTFEQELQAADRVVDSCYNAQIANTLALSRHSISCGVLPINYNFPMHCSSDQLRAANPDLDGEDTADDVKIFHYLGNGEVNKQNFETDESVDALLSQESLTRYASVFQRKLRIVNERINAIPPARLQRAS